MPETQGNPAPDAGQGGDPAPKYVTVEDLNRAITKRLSEFSVKHEKSIAEMSASLSAKLDSFTGAPRAAPDGDTHTPSGNVEDHPVVKGMVKRLADVEKRAKDAEDSAAAERAKSRDADMRRRLSDALAGHGVDSMRLKHAIGYLVDVQKHVRLADDGDDIVFRDVDGDVDLATGLKAWVKSDDGKLYLPPRGAQGSGDRPGASPAKPAGDALSREHVGEMLLKHLTGN